MLRPSLHSLDFGLLLHFLLVSPALATIASNWTNPPARYPSFTSSYSVGERIYLSWQPLNESSNDLWLVRYDTSENFTLRIASSIDISRAGSFPWTIAVSQDEVEQDTRFALIFVPAGSNYLVGSDSDLESPAFNLLLVNQATPPNGTVALSSTTTADSTTPTTSISAVTSTYSYDPSVSSSPASSDNSSLSNASIAGIAAGVLAAVGLACFLGGYWFFKKRLARHTQKVETNSDVPMTGPYEVLGSSRSPSEINSKEVQVHEMVSSEESLAHESDSVPVHEVGNTVKRPGLHEMPG